MIIILTFILEWKLDLSLFEVLKQQPLIFLFLRAHCLVKQLTCFPFKFCTSYESIFRFKIYLNAEEGLISCTPRWKLRLDLYSFSSFITWLHKYLPLWRLICIIWIKMTWSFYQWWILENYWLEWFQNRVLRSLLCIYQAIH